ncbi:hypothetical protein ISF_03118 [Cordyceps fumosorosea ARSEF 2679]|uniref:Uncharacterized protein n=1 Tax=Cordyceps fumosorosea (strain ARSEF 2679) TaxID=1081104 RepID=A0A168BAH8_CORFA|nr:hypothetical protein ISF_03118 [Cordyceps fumosorosea ARSEF 2679]OAA69848.1 hypothetical protein ISF_03118 [Cordyceps fumosorosea ARSEF 2679]
MKDEVLTGGFFRPSRGQNYTYIVSNYERVAKPAYHVELGNFYQRLESFGWADGGDRQSTAWSLFNSGGIEGVIVGLEMDALLAKKYPGIFSGFQNPISNGQWRKEVGYWFNIGLAKLQFGLINIAVGPPDPTLPDLQNMLPTLTVGQEHLAHRICTSQKIYSPDHKNYNTAGFIFLSVVGGLIGLLPLLKPYILRGLSRGRTFSLNWSSYSSSQMQRMAIEGGVAGNWEYLDDNIPRLIPHDASAGYVDLEYSDPNDPNRQRHPKLSNDTATEAIQTGADASSAADSRSEEGAGPRRSAERAVEMQPLAANASPNSRPTGQKRGG